MATWHTKRIKPADVASHIRYLCGEDLKDREPRVTLLVGAGCSVSAGIPAASKIVQEHLKPHPLLKNKPPPPGGVSEYAHLMGCLPPADRMDVIERCIEAAQGGTPARTKLNWAHLLIATLVHHRYVRHILTTNFDPLLTDAMAITDQPIRTFDLTASDFYMPGRIGRGSIMYLHGQSHGMLQTHTSEDTEKVRQRVRSVLHETLQQNALIVIGYSGLCDPVFEELRAVPQYQNMLYWVHYDTAGEPPPQHLIDFIETPGREARLVVDEDDEWMDADTALQRIVIEGLKLQLLPLVAKPLDHVQSALARLCGQPKAPVGQPEPPDPIRAAQAVLHNAKSAMNRGVRPSGDQALADSLETRIALASLTDNVAELDRLAPAVKSEGIEPLREALGTAYMRAGGRLALSEPEKAISLLERANELGGQDEAWVLTHWGIALAKLGLQDQGEKSNELLQQAYVKFDKAIRIKPDMHQAFHNWAFALSQSAAQKQGEESYRLYQEACDKLARALQSKSDKPDTLQLWGHTLIKQAQLKDGDEADRLFKEACDKCAAAVELQPDRHEAFNAWGFALAQRAELNQSEQADTLFEQAAQKYARAIAIKPDSPRVLNDWAASLTGLARRKYGPEADRLFEQAYDKYAKAIEIKPDFCEAISNWGAGLANQAQQKRDETSESLFNYAAEKYNHALRLCPKHTSTLFNLGCLEAARGNVPKAITWLERWQEGAPNACRKDVDLESDFDAIRDEPVFREFRDSLPS